MKCLNCCLYHSFLPCNLPSETFFNASPSQLSKDSSSHVLNPSDNSCSHQPLSFSSLHLSPVLHSRLSKIPSSFQNSPHLNNVPRNIPHLPPLRPPQIVHGHNLPLPSVRLQRSHLREQPRPNVQRLRIPHRGHAHPTLPRWPRLCPPGRLESGDRQRVQGVLQELR